MVRRNNVMIGYKIHTNYFKVTFYHFGKRYGGLLATETFTSDRKRPRKERYERICEVMDEMGFIPPVYRKTKR